MAQAGGTFEELTLEKLETFLLRFADERRTGQLKIQGSGAKGGRVDLREGKIVAVDSPFVSETLGDVARKLGFLQKGDVQRAVDALSRADNAGRPLADILLGEKLITPDGLEACLRFQAESAIHSLIGFHGRISFLPGNVSASEIALDPRQVLELMRQRDKVEEMGSAFLNMVPEPDKTPAGGLPAVASPEFESQSEVRRIAQTVIREAAEAAARAAELDAQAAGAAEAMIADRELPPAPPPQVPLIPLSSSETGVPGVGEPARAPGPRDDADLFRLARVVLDITRPGSSSTDALLAYATQFGKRALLFASTSKGMRVAGHRCVSGTTFPPNLLDGLQLPPSTKGTVARVMKERQPARGPFKMEGPTDEQLMLAVQPLPVGDMILFPIALHERAIGMLYVDGVPPGDPGLVEGLAAAVAATAVVMENKLLIKGRPG